MVLALTMPRLEGLEGVWSRFCGRSGGWYSRASNSGSLGLPLSRWRLDSLHPLMWLLTIR